ncbi:glycoside hydrolase family 95 protein [Robinsoniella peoriensis]|uniref:glycoside hydrolase family 95 protein n=1 Tax=Robinsoniella peoriensis TaxID=180332 RepID=UPI003642A17F
MERKMELWYDSPGREWKEALPIGNGSLGAMVYGKIHKETIQLNEESIWSGKPVDRNNPDCKRYLNQIRCLIRKGKLKEAQQMEIYAMSGVPQSQRCYQTAGDLTIEFAGNAEVSGYRRSLDLENGICHVSYEVGETRYEREIFSSYPDQVLAVHLQAIGEGTLDFHCLLKRCRNVSENYMDESWSEHGDTIGFKAGSTGKGIGYAAMLRAAVIDGKVEIIGEHLIVQDAKDVTLYLVIATTFQTKDIEENCRKRLDLAAEMSYDELRKRHKLDFQQLFGGFAIRFGRECRSEIPTDERLHMLKQGKEDIDLLALYAQFGRYLLISSSRPGCLPANLQGIWNDEMSPPWHSKFTININTQMNYWPAEKANLSQCHLPLFKLLERIKENGKKTACIMYGCRGSVAHHNTDIYADTAPQDQVPSASYWVMGEAWLALHIWEHYLYTKDKIFLEEHFDCLYQPLLFFQDFLIKNENGYLVTSPSVSPENTYILPNGERGTICEGPTMDVEILYELIRAYLNACHELKKKDAFIKEAKKILSKLKRPGIGKYGQLQEWMEDYEEEEPGHRHISHLFGIYPGTMITREETPDLYKAAYVSLQRRLANGGGHTGWSRAWIAGLWARFGKAEYVYENILELLSQSTYSNLMDNHPRRNTDVFQIDGNLGGLNGILEMLVQCRNGCIYLLPALPKACCDGEIRGMCLPGKAKLEMEWTLGKVKQYCIYAEQDFKADIFCNEEHQKLSIKMGNKYQWLEGNACCI